MMLIFQINIFAIKMDVIGTKEITFVVTERGKNNEQIH